MNFGTAISSIVLAGAKPVFVDVNKETLQIDVKKIKAKISKNTKVLLIPNLIGNIPDWKQIKKIARQYKLKIIEDSADTLGAKINNISTGNYSDISITSFYGSHIISCAGNGGMFLTNNKEFYNQAKILRSWGRMSSLLKDSENIKKRLSVKLMGLDYDQKFVFSKAGYNFEPSEIGAAFGNIQLKKFKNFSKMRNKNFDLHFDFFKRFKDFFILPKISTGIRTNFLAYPIIIKENNIFKKNDLQIFLEKKKIQTRPIFSGNALRHPAFTNLISKVNKVNTFLNSDYIMRNGILIGCHHGLSNKNINYIHDQIKKFLIKKSLL